MAQSKDIGISQAGWIHELARAEWHPEAEKLLQYGRTFDPQQLVEESTIDFLTVLHERFSEYARVFNGYSEEGTKFAEVKIYNIAQSAADFMIFRNQVKLVVTNIAHGVIHIAFARHIRGSLAVDGQIQSLAEQDGTPELGEAQEIQAQIGPFRNIHWTFQGEKVSPEDIAKFYFAEFIRATRESKRSRGGNKVLFEQIKSFLEEKGFDL